MEKKHSQKECSTKFCTLGASPKLRSPLEITLFWSASQKLNRSEFVR
jgi:hypothetical protein